MRVASGGGAERASAGQASGGTGIGGAGGAGGASGTDANLCPPGTTFPGGPPDINSPYVSGSQIPATSSQVNVQSLGVVGALLDMHEYIVAVATYDEVFNIGALSPLMCIRPLPPNTYFKEYCADGGPGCGGCGNCNVGTGGGSLLPMFGAVALGGVVIAVRRDRRRKRRRVEQG